MRSEFGGTWEDPGGSFFEFAVKRALKQDQIVHMEVKLQVILYFSREWVILKLNVKKVAIKVSKFKSYFKNFI